MPTRMEARKTRGLVREKARGVPEIWLGNSLIIGHGHKMAPSSPTGPPGKFQVPRTVALPLLRFIPSGRFGGFTMAKGDGQGRRTRTPGRHTASPGPDFIPSSNKSLA